MPGKRKKSIYLSVLLFTFFLSVPSIEAQEITPAIPPQISALGNPVEDFLSSLIARLTQGNIPQDLEKMRKAGLPGDVIIKEIGVPTGTVKSQAAADNSTGFKAASEYKILEAAGQPPSDIPVTNDLDSFFGNLLGQVGDFLGGVIGIGNQSARNLASSEVPLGVAQQILAQNDTVHQNGQLARTGDEKVLAAEGQNMAMANTLPFLQKVNLPYGVIIDNHITNANPANPTPSPADFPPNNPVQPTVAAGTGLSYNIPVYSNADTVISNMETLAIAIGKRWPTSMIGKWQEVHDAASAKGINPGLVLSIWIEETGASDVCTLADKYYAVPAHELEKEKFGDKYGIWDFGVVSLPKSQCGDDEKTKLEKFHSQLDAFLAIFDKIENPVTFEKFMCRYSEGKAAPCEFTINPGFVDRLPRVYDCLTNRNNNFTGCPSGYFAF